MVDEVRQEAESRDKVRYIERNDQLWLRYVQLRYVQWSVKKMTCYVAE